MMSSADVIRHFHCSGPPDEILNVEAIDTALDRGRKRVGFARNAAIPGKDSLLCPTKTGWEDQLKKKGPSLKTKIIVVKIFNRYKTSSCEKERVLPC